MGLNQEEDAQALVVDGGSGCGIIVLAVAMRVLPSIVGDLELPIALDVLRRSTTKYRGTIHYA